VSIDHFGNLITDIDMEFLVGKLGSFDRSRVQAWLGDYRLDGLHHHYGEVAANMPVVVTGSRGCLEISVNQGSAAFFFNASTAMPVRVIFPVD
jgi:S-adenosylmethionine hydrolase